MSMTKREAEAAGLLEIQPPVEGDHPDDPRPGETSDDYNGRMNAAVREHEVVACAEAVVGAYKGLDYLCLRGAELSDGDVRRAFIDAAADIQRAVHRLDRTLNIRRLP